MAEAIRNDLRIYDKVAGQWWSDEIRWVRTLKNLVPGRLSWFDQQVEWNGRSVLDLGCAGGFMSEALAAKGAIVKGIDPAAGAISAAKKHATTGGFEISYQVAVGEELPYDDEAFDVVVCVDVLEHVSDLPRVLGEVSRVLVPGGIFLYDTINRNPLSSFLAVTVAEDILGLLPQGTHDPRMFIKPGELKDELSSAGLVPGKTKGLGPIGINRKGDFVFRPLPLRLIIYMGIARKPDTK